MSKSDNGQGASAAPWYGKVDTTLYGLYRHPNEREAMQLTEVQDNGAIVLERLAGAPARRVVVKADKWPGEWVRVA